MLRGRHLRNVRRRGFGYNILLIQIRNIDPVLVRECRNDHAVSISPSSNSRGGSSLSSPSSTSSIFTSSVFGGTSVVSTTARGRLVVAIAGAGGVSSSSASSSALRRSCSSFSSLCPHCEKISAENDNQADMTDRIDSDMTVRP